MKNDEAIIHCALNALSSQIEALKEMVNSLCSMQETNPQLFQLAEEGRKIGNPLSTMAEELALPIDTLQILARKVEDSK